MSTRKEFLVGCSAAIAAMAGAKFGNLSFAERKSTSPYGGQVGSPGDQTLVVIFLRGGMDGLNLLAPIDDKDYQAARSQGTIIDDKGLSLKNAYAGHDFRLHRFGSGLKELYDANQLAFIHASGLTNGTRSHFEAQDLVDLGVANIQDLHQGSGWLERLIQSHGQLTGAIPISSMSGNIPKSLLGSSQAASISSPANFGFNGSPDQKKALQSIYSGSGVLAEAGAKTLATLDLVQSHIDRDSHDRPIPYKPENGVKYTNGSLARALEGLSQLIKMDVGLQFATIDYGGWDTHQAQGYQFDRQIQEMNGALSAFWNDIGPRTKNTTVVCVSEFGRRVKANQSNGTDHGHGNCMLVLGGDVKGGMTHGIWPGLATDQLDQRADLAVTTDYRWVLAELAAKKYGITDHTALFPGMKEVKNIGVFS